MKRADVQLRVTRFVPRSPAPQLEGFTMWKDHGTKILGALGTLTGIFAGADPAAVTGLLGDRGPGIVMSVLSLLTILRGFTNSANTPPK